MALFLSRARAVHFHAGSVTVMLARRGPDVRLSTSCRSTLLSSKPAVHAVHHVSIRSMADVPVQRDVESSNRLKSSPSTQHGNDSKSQQEQNPTPNFDDVKTAFETKSIGELVRAVVVFGLCQIPILVKNAESSLRFSRAILGNGITDSILKATMFGHFCAGENEGRIQPVILALEKAGVGSILDYVAEDDGSGKAARKTGNAKQGGETITDQISWQMIPKARVYDYESEAKCDRHVEVFKKCINDVAHLQKDGFAAVKVTALVNPKLLERMSRAIVEAQNLFRRFDSNGDGVIGLEEFEHGFKVFFKDEDMKLREMVNDLQATGTRDSAKVDYITWSMLLTPKDLPSITAGCREVGPLATATPTDEEVELIERLYERGHALAQEAAACGVRLLIDAEQVRFQPAIDNFVLLLQRTYNATSKSDRPVVYNTYQCYLKDTPMRLRTDLERSERFDYHFGAKLVRGAYFESERALAELLGYPSPIHETIEDTHQCYNESVKYLLQYSVNSTKSVELMLATHNQESIEMAIAAMNEFNIDRSASTLCFAQLYGMMDKLTFNLGKNGYHVYKYLPYGEVMEAMPYLIRRANENSAIAGGAGRELHALTREISRRLVGPFRH